ncbi:hypothetical protein L1887_33391 [Cichorium endivia]|nr:hypothetical protein L1887_33391 [Cichorium endivia]
MQVFSATSANITGKIPDFFDGDAFAGLTTLHLSYNYLEGGLPSSFSGSSIQSLWLNWQKSRSRLNETLDVLQNMTQLTELWLHGNSFSGHLPDFSGLQSLKVVNLTNNLLQGPTPSFDKSKMGLAGTISPDFSSFKSLQRLILANNNLNGTIPEESLHGFCSHFV